MWKVRAGKRVNSVGLGDTGRYRTNVWDYAGVNTFSASREAYLAMHPTGKPVALIGDAIRDCSRRGDIILDMFRGFRQHVDRGRTGGAAGADDRV